MLHYSVASRRKYADCCLVTAHFDVVFVQMAGTILPLHEDVEECWFGYQ